MNLALLQLRSVPIGTWLPSPVALLFNSPVRGLLPKMNREPININNDGAQYGALKAQQDKCVKDNDTEKTRFLFL